MLHNYSSHYITYLQLLKTRWTEQTIAPFAAVKQALVQAMYLAHPKPDVPTHIICDASDNAVGAVLQQFMNEKWCPIAFFKETSTSKDKVQHL